MFLAGQRQIRRKWQSHRQRPGRPSPETGQTVSSYAANVTYENRQVAALRVFLVLPRRFQGRHVHRPWGKYRTNRLIIAVQGQSPSMLPDAELSKSFASSAIRPATVRYSSAKPAPLRHAIPMLRVAFQPSTSSSAISPPWVISDRI